MPSSAELRGSKHETKAALGATPAPPVSKANTGTLPALFPISTITVDCEEIVKYSSVTEEE
jgi:hypothetical protein